MITIKELLSRYQSGSVTPQEHIHCLLESIRQGFHESKDPAWICVATSENIEKQLSKLESLASQKTMANLPLYGIPCTN